MRAAIVNKNPSIPAREARNYVNETTFFSWSMIFVSSLNQISAIVTASLSSFGGTLTVLIL